MLSVPGLFDRTRWTSLILRILAAWRTALRFLGWPRTNQDLLTPEQRDDGHEAHISPVDKDAVYAHEFRPSLLSLGSTGFTFRVSECIAVKKARPGRLVNLANERRIFEILDRHPPSPYLIQSFYRTEDAIFLEYASGGDLASLLGEKQLRDDGSQRVTGVVTRQPRERCLRWMAQLGAAAAWLERLGLAHCDIRPGNMLLCHSDQIKLADFDRSVEIGVDLLSGTEPFARLLGAEGGLDRGTYGKAGSRTEQFAIGSVLYSLTRGYDPFEDEWWGPDHGPIRMEKLQRMELPLIGDLDCDGFISKCWLNQYISIAELSTSLAAFSGNCWKVTCDEVHSRARAEARECEMMFRCGKVERLVTR